MVFFFAIAAVEIVQSLMPGDDLNPLRKAFNPLFATIGGVLGPISVYLGLNILIGSTKLINGWGIPTATDIALAWLIARFVFGAAHPAVKFLLLLAVADDAIGLVIIGLFYPDQVSYNEHLFEVNEAEAKTSTLANFEHQWSIIVDYGLLLFGITNAAFIQRDIQGAAKMGALLSVTAAPLAFALRILLHIEKAEDSCVSNRASK